MTSMGDLFLLPFMQRAFLAGIVLAAVLSLLGVFATLKRISFFGDGIAHASLAGIALGLLAGVHPLGVAIVTALLFGAGVYVVERKTTLSTDAAVGIFFTGGMALGIVLLSMQKGFQPDLMSYLFGSILAIRTADVWLIGGTSAAIIAFLVVSYRRLALLILDPTEAWLSGIAREALEFALYLVLSVAVVLGVKLLGVILVSALLIIPPATAKVVARSFRSLAWLSVLVGECMVLGGLMTSYILDLPSGATIVLVGTTLFTVVALWHGLRRHGT